MLKTLKMTSSKQASYSWAHNECVLVPSVPFSCTSWMRLTFPPKLLAELSIGLFTRTGRLISSSNLQFHQNFPTSCKGQAWNLPELRQRVRHHTYPPHLVFASLITAFLIFTSSLSVRLRTRQPKCKFVVYGGHKLEATS